MEGPIFLSLSLPQLVVHCSLNHPCQEPGVIFNSSSSFFLFTKFQVLHLPCIFQNPLLPYILPLSQIRLINPASTLWQEFQLVSLPPVLPPTPRSIFQTVSTQISTTDLTMSFPILPFKSFLMDLSCYLQHTRSPMNQHCLHPNLISHLSRLLSSHPSLKCYAPARKACLWSYHICFIVSGFSNFSGCTLYLNYLLFFIWLTPHYPLKINSVVIPSESLSCLLLNTSLPKQD